MSDEFITCTFNMEYYFYFVFPFIYKYKIHSIINVKHEIENRKILKSFLNILNLK